MWRGGGTSTSGGRGLVIRGENLPLTVGVRFTARLFGSSFTSAFVKSQRRFTSTKLPVITELNLNP